MKNTLNELSICWRFVKTCSCVALLAALAATQLSHAQNVLAWGDNSQGQTNVPPAATNVVAVAGGRYHSLALRADGTIVGWGGTNGVPGGITNATAIAAGDYHSVALLADGTVTNWGDNTYGQLNMPASVTNVIAIAAGAYFTLALHADGTVVAWGRNYGYGGNAEPTNIPPSTTNVIAIAAGPLQGLVIRADRSVVVWGVYYQSIPYGYWSLASPMPWVFTNVEAVSGSMYEDLALVAGGGVRQWLAKYPLPPASATNVVAFASSTNYNMALTTDGRVLNWGSNSIVAVPPYVSNAVAIAGGAWHSLAIISTNMLPQILGPLPLAYQNQAYAGSPLPLYVRAIGSQPLHYQWFADGVPIPGTDSAFPQIPAVFGTDNVKYQVVLSNPVGSVTSAVAQVKVLAANAWGENLVGQCRIPLSVTNPTTIAAGALHCLALNPDGTITAWGKNYDGQATVPAAANNVMAIAAGSDHSLALRNDGSVVAWGRNWDGQTNVPAAATNVVAISGGFAHSLALRGDGTVLAWGNDDNGQTDVSFLPNDIIAISAGYYHNMALRPDGTVLTWGWDIPTPATATNVVAISAGWEHSLALRADGSVVAWGDNTFGQATVPAGLGNVVAIAAGFYHNLALRADGTVVSWGKEFGGMTNVPAGLTGVTAIAVGRNFSVAIVGTGAPVLTRQPCPATVHAGQMAVLTAGVTGAWPLTFQWYHDGIAVSGATNAYLIVANAQATDNGSYTLQAINGAGQATSQPVNLTVLSAPSIGADFTIRNVPIGGSICLQADAGGSQPLACQWQLNGTNLVDGPRVTGATTGILCLNGALVGDGGIYTLILSNAYGSVTGAVAQVSASPVVVWGDDSADQYLVPPQATNLVAVAAGGLHSLAVRADGAVVAWGDDSFGQNEVPAAVTNVVAVAEGAMHSLALRADGTVVAWGDNTYGQTNVPYPLRTIIAIAAGGSHNLALQINGTVLAWGNNQTNVPATASNVVAIAAGGNYSLVLRKDGAVICWGGLGPAPAAATNVVAIAAGDGHALALRADGTVLAWGDNTYGQTLVPVWVTNAVGIAAGDRNSLALLAGGQVVAWGADDYGQSTVPPYVTTAVTLGAGAAHGLALLSEGTVANAAQDRWSWGPVSTWIALDGAASAAVPANRQWYNDGTAIAGANGRFLIFTNAQTPDARSYELRGTDALGRATSQTIHLLVQSSPFVATAPTVQAVSRGGAIGFWSAVLGQPPFSYQWQFNGTNLQGTSYTAVNFSWMWVTNAAFSDAGNYSLVASNSYGSTTGLVVTLIVPPVKTWGADVWAYPPPSVTNVPPSATNVVAIATGDDCGYALRGDGTFVEWGDERSWNLYGPLRATNVIAIAAAGPAFLALQSDGTVRSLGIPAPPVSATNVVAIACSSSTGMGLRTDGTVVSWPGAAGPPGSPSNIVAVAAGGGFDLALRNDGAVIAWGSSALGTNVPPSATNVVAIAAFDYNSLAVRADGTVVAWGIADYGQLDVPASATNVVAVAVGLYNCMALRSDGTVVQWGTNPYSQVDVPPVVTNVSAISMGAWYNMALLRDPLHPPMYQSFQRPTGLGSSATFTSIPVPGGVATYQWQFNGTNIVGATNAALSIGVVDWTNAGTYSVIISNNLGVTTGPPMVMSVERMPLQFDLSSSTPPTNTNGFHLRLLGASGSGPVVVYASSDLDTWQPIYTNPPGIGPIEFNDPGASGQGARFYRATEFGTSPD